MAAVLQPWLGDRLLVEASMALIWDFHGVQVNSVGRSPRVVTDEDTANADPQRKIKILSAQRDLALQVVEIKRQPAGDWKLTLSDKLHTVSTLISQGTHQDWESRNGEVFEDITNGTLLDIQDVSFEFWIQQMSAQAKPKVFCAPVLRLHDFRVVGCHGESIFGRPIPFSKHPWFSVLNHTLTWWFARKCEPLPDPYGRLLLTMHKECCQRRINGYYNVDKYIKGLCEYSAPWKDEKHHLWPLWNFMDSMLRLDDGSAEHIKVVLEAMGALASQDSPNDISRASASGPAPARPELSKKDPLNNAPSSKYPQTAHNKLSGAANEYQDLSSGTMVASIAPPSLKHGSYNVPPSTSFPGGDFSTMSWTRRDGRIRADQLLVLKSNPWIPASAGQSDPRASLPLSVLEEITAKKPIPSRALPREEAASASSEAPKSFLMPKSPIATEHLATQETLYPSDWSESPEPRRQLPPDSDDEEPRQNSKNPKHPTLEASPSYVRSNGFSTLVREEWPEAISHSAKKRKITTRDSDQRNIPSKQGQASHAFTTSSHPSPYVEIPVYTMTSPSSSSAEPEPHTPVVQVPATAPSPRDDTGQSPVPAVQIEPKPGVRVVPDTMMKPVTRPRLLKQRSSGREVQEDQDQELRMPSPGSTPSDPAEEMKRIRTEFFAEQRTARDAQAAVASKSRIKSVVSSGPDQWHSSNNINPLPREYTAPQQCINPSQTHLTAQRQHPFTPTSQIPSSDQVSSPYAQFQRRHPSYKGIASHFTSLSALSARLIAEGKLLATDRDDFILIHAAEYRPYSAMRVEAGEDVVPFEEFWRQRRGSVAGGGMDGKDVGKGDGKGGDVENVVRREEMDAGDTGDGERAERIKGKEGGYKRDEEQRRRKQKERRRRRKEKYGNDVEEVFRQFAKKKEKKK